MKRCSLMVISLAILIAAGGIVVGVLTIKSSADVGEIWVSGRGGARTIELRQSGEYASYRSCDVCVPSPKGGRWFRSRGNTVSLRNLN